MIFIELFFLNLQQRMKWKKKQTKKQKEQTYPIKYEKKNNRIEKVSYLRFCCSIFPWCTWTILLDFKRNQTVFYAYIF